MHGTPRGLTDSEGGGQPAGAEHGREVRRITRLGHNPSAGGRANSGRCGVLKQGTQAPLSTLFHCWRRPGFALLGACFGGSGNVHSEIL